MTDEADKQDPAVKPKVRGHNRELWVGVFVILGMAAIMVGLFTLTDASMFRGRYVVTTQVPDAAGIRRGDPVQMRGVNIGRVQSFHISQEGVAIKLEVEGEYKIPADSHVQLKASSLLGGMAADVIPGKSAEFLRGGETMPGKGGDGILEATTGITDKAQVVLDRAQSLFSEKTVQNVEASGNDLRLLMADLSAVAKKQRTEIAALTESLRRSAAGAEKLVGRPELDSALKRLDSMTERLDGTVKTLDKSTASLDAILGRIDRGEGTIGKLSKDESLYLNLDRAVANMSQAAVEMKELTADIRKQPKKYLKISVF
jgi:phospholipid/cholesterol/gamma-HCH transport system substrate-binding protein